MRTAPGSTDDTCACWPQAVAWPLEAHLRQLVRSCVSVAAPTVCVCVAVRHWLVLADLPCPFIIYPQAYRDKESDFAAKQSEYAAVTAERDEVRGAVQCSGRFFQAVGCLPAGVCYGQGTPVSSRLGWCKTEYRTKGLTAVAAKSGVLLCHTAGACALRWPAQGSPGRLHGWVQRHQVRTGCVLRAAATSSACWCEGSRLAPQQPQHLHMFEYERMQ